MVKAIQYGPFGEVLWDSAPNLRVPLGYAGGLYDPHTGLTRFGWRDYDADTARWTALDPLGDGGGDSDWYGYCLDDPVNLYDPRGLSSQWGGLARGDHGAVFGSMMNAQQRDEKADAAEAKSKEMAANIDKGFNADQFAKDSGLDVSKYDVKGLSEDQLDAYGRGITDEHVAKEEAKERSRKNSKNKDARQRAAINAAQEKNSYALSKAVNNQEQPVAVVQEESEETTNTKKAAQAKGGLFDNQDKNPSSKKSYKSDFTKDIRDFNKAKNNFYSGPAVYTHKDYYNAHGAMWSGIYGGLAGLGNALVNNTNGFTTALLSTIGIGMLPAAWAMSAPGAIGATATGLTNPVTAQRIGNFVTGFADKGPAPANYSGIAGMTLGKMTE